MACKDVLPAGNCAWHFGVHVISDVGIVPAIGNPMLTKVRQGLDSDRDFDPFRKQGFRAVA
jgi:hypothetical protein